ncbi:MAG TPA: type IV pilus twitching motility protein PilT [Polyangiales bacterium]|nr:type IV pilus twitching motility protein PilT [Polyangiales bacterium]
MLPTLPQLLRFATDNGASDLHISAGQPPLVRVHGDLRRLELAALSPADARKLIYEAMSDEQRRTFTERLELDFSFAVAEQRFRVNAFMQNRGPGAVLRSIPSAIPSLGDLALPEVVRRLAEQEKGLVLVTGPTGSGKSTTLAAMIDHINSSEPGHILTLEDPIEFVHTSKRCLINQREIGQQSKSFGIALRSALREDPDVILIGELRDLETTSLAMTAAETGHLVLATMHTSSAPKTVDRIMDMYPAEQQGQIRSMLSESLLGVLSQMLVKKRGGGRVGVLEILVGTPAVRNLIREGKTHQIPSTMQVAGKSGMQTMEMALSNLVTRGVIELAEARARMPSSEVLAAMQRNAPAGAGP